MLNIDLAPARTALLIVDMQRCFVDPAQGGVPDGFAVLERVNALARECRRAGMPVIFTAHVLRADGSNTGVLAELSVKATRGDVMEGRATAELQPELEVLPEDHVVRKPRFGAFHGTELELLLRCQSIDTLIVGGISTSYCVETTVREAAVRDFRVLMLSDGTAAAPLPDGRGGTISAEDLQRASCAVVGHALGEVATVAETISRVRGAAPEERAASAAQAQPGRAG